MQRVDRRHSVKDEPVSDYSDFEIAEVRKSGADLVTTTYGLLRTLKVFAVENKSAQAVLQKFKALTANFFQFNDTIDIQLVGNQYFINNHKTVAGLSGMDTFNKFADEMAGRGVGTITLHQGLDDEEIGQFAKFFMDFAPRKDFPKISTAISRMIEST